MSERELVVSRSLARTLILSGELVKARFAEAMDQLDLPVPLARTLLALGAPEPMRDLADHLACDPSHVTGIADRLEERGLVRRVVGHDRRVKLLALTDDGRDMRDRVIAVAASASPINRLSADQRHALLEILEQLLEDEPAGTPETATAGNGR